MKYTLLFICIICLLIENSDELNCHRDRSLKVNTELNLKLNLFCEYEAGVLPARNLEVTVDMTPEHFTYNWDDPKMKLRLNFTYNDKNLKWSPTEYGNIRAITVDGISDIKLWMPSLAFDEALDQGNTLEKCSILGCLILSNGTVYCEFICDLVVQCHSNFENWPFDSHYCVLRILSRYNTSEINLKTTPFDMRTFAKVDNPKWKIKIRKNLYFADDELFYSEGGIFNNRAEFYFIIRRHSSHDFNTITAALLIFSVTNILAQISDLRSSTRILLIFLSIMSHLCYLPYLSWSIPKYKDRIPSIALLFFDSFALTMLLLIETAILRAVGKANDKPPPGYVRKTISILDDKLFGKFFELDADFSDVRVDFPVLRALKIENGNPENLKWWQYVKIIDRFFLLAWVTFFLIGFCLEIRYRLY